MTSSCSNDMRALAPATCPAPTYAAQRERETVSTYLDGLLADISPDLLEEDGRLRLVVGSQALAETVRSLLADRGRHDVDVVVAVPAQSLNYQPRAKRWTPQLQQARKAKSPQRTLVAARPQVAQAPVDTKARKAARKRAKAGRKACR